MRKLVLILWLTIVGVVLVRLSAPSSPGPVNPPHSSEQERRHQKDDADFRRAVSGAETLRRAMRNPNSFELESVHIKDDGSTCYEYRTQNGSDGMNQEFAVVLPGDQTLNKNTFAWNKHCAHSPGSNETSEVKYALAH
jgi:hypothetical protein